MLNNNIKKLLVPSMSLVLLGAGSSAIAHTGFQNQITGSSTTYNSLVIGHTCTLPTNNKKVPLVAQSVLFPAGNPKNISEGKDTTDTPILYEGTSTDPSTLKITDIITSATGLAGIPQLIQDKNIFAVQREKTDSFGNVIGFESFRGRLDPALYGLVPFRTSGISFKGPNLKDSNGNLMYVKDQNGNNTADLLYPIDSCVKKLVVKVAVADICNTAFPAGGPKDGMANLWIPNPTTAKFKKPLDGSVPSAWKEGDPIPTQGGSPATLTINRDTTANPLPAECGAGKTVTVWPSDDYIEKNLIMKGVWGR